MFRLIQYITTVQGTVGGIRALPLWARIIVVLFALPGIVLLALSLALFLVSISALLLLTAPVYRLLQRISGPRSVTIQQDEGVTTVTTPPEPESQPAPRRHIDVTIIE